MRLFLSSILLSSILALCADSALPATLDDLKKLEILCYVPAWLPKGFKLTSVSITYDEPGPDEKAAAVSPLPVGILE